MTVRMEGWFTFDRGASSVAQFSIDGTTGLLHVSMSPKMGIIKACKEGFFGTVITRRKVKVGQFLFASASGPCDPGLDEALADQRCFNFPRTNGCLQLDPSSAFVKHKYIETIVLRETQNICISADMSTDQKLYFKILKILIYGFH
jgi:hypothetical protein